MNRIAIAAETLSEQAKAEHLADQLQYPLAAITTQDFVVLLVVTAMHLELRLTAEDAPGAVLVDFVHGAVAHRREYGGGKGQLIAKAVGLKRRQGLTVLDLTAGLGRDAFVLANCGCDVTMLERSNVIAVLLADGLQRAAAMPWFETLKLSLVQSDAKQYLAQLAVEHYPQVIYLDPMYPDAKKTALVKKEMRVLRHVVGDDVDAADLLNAALKVATLRVVVKRAKLAPNLNDCIPDLILKGKSSRYDIYFPIN